MPKSVKPERANPTGKITLVLKETYRRLEEDAERNKRTAKAQAEYILQRHYESEHVTSAQSAG